MGIGPLDERRRTWVEKGPIRTNVPSEALSTFVDSPNPEE
jgi:hypothetical protein